VNGPGTARPARILTFGDALVDVIVETGRAAVPDDDVPAHIRVGAGGQAANVAAWAVHLGATAGVITALGTDPPGRLVREWLEARRVSVLGPGTTSTGTVVSLVASDGRRTMLSDRSPGPALRGADLAAGWFTGAGWLHLSGYALLGPDDPEAALAAAARAGRAGARVSVDLSAATLVATRGRERVAALLRAVHAELVFGNELEFEAAGALDVPVRVVKRGARGCRVLADGRAVDVPAVVPTAVRDTTGAGDAFAAGWLVGGAEMATAAASLCVALPGAMPPIAVPGEVPPIAVPGEVPPAVAP
jgi:sugar/nucleoside kinase (ribokinase family)